MVLTTTESMIIILAIAMGTFLTRLIPFILFPANKKTPEFVDYLGSVLPFAVMGMLVVYCLKGMDFLDYPYGIAEAAAVLFVVAIHKWKHNTLLSIGGGTVLYMFLVQAVFK
ncbi:branched-chain amino acid transporter permease [Anaerobium acetethylicum]|uniref:Branched-chain amino acid transport protein AzlD n=1 Tax=Anaerobium acetethylicum TaxID=1619234 RepID=A0A1D3TTY2_9FIRM|nr:branched-chain amino acid transporter permease [Anaerobium acetethylicum]SCP97451.1 Branched-chain amino acid transport protein AzlD [Anaerobium acetethylicum]